MIRRIKQIIVFLLVTISIYSTFVFVLMMSIHADSRLQQIDYLEKSKPYMQEKVLFMDRIANLNDRIRYFTVSRLSFKIPKPKNCINHQTNQALLIISASAFDPVTIFIKLLRQLELGIDKCEEPEIFVVKRNKPLAFNNEQNIAKFSFQIGQIIKYLTIEAEYELSIFSYEQGSLLTLSYFARKPITILLTNIVQRIKTIIFVDIGHPFIRIQYDPPHKFMQKIKKQINKQPQRMKIFNKMKLIFIATHHQQSVHEKFLFTSQTNNLSFTFTNTILISSRQIANVHYYLPPNSLSFPPFVRRIGHFLSKSFVSDMSVNEIGSFFRYGESYKYEKIDYQKVKNCNERDLYQDFTLMSMDCIKLNPLKLKDGQVLLIYAAMNFEMYGFNYQKIYPFDNLTEGSIYLLEKIDQQVYIINQQMVNIHISKQFFANPKNPLNISLERLLMESQLIFSNYSIIKVCPNLYLTFPLHFAQGNIQRQFLQQSEKDCFQQSNFLQQFSRKIFVQWSYFRNLLVFTLLCSQFFNHRPVSSRLLTQFIVNYLLICGKAEIQKKIIFNTYIIALSILVQFITGIIASIGSNLNLFKKFTSLLLLSISGICILGMIVKLFNYWKIFLISIIFFINRQNITLFLIKVYFLKDDIAYQGLTFYNFGDIGLLTMWIYINLPIHKEKDEQNLMNKAQKLFCGLLLIIVCIGLQNSGSFLSSVITIYMKIMIVIKMLRIMKK